MRGAAVEIDRLADFTGMFTIGTAILERTPAPLLQMTT
jgi:hypothetical protein